MKEKTLASPLWRLAVEETMVLSQDSLGMMTQKHTHPHTHTDGIVMS